MAQQEQTTFVIKAIEQGFDKVITKLEKTNQSQQKVGKSAQRAGVQFDKFGRRMRGAADMSSNATKNFSKMQQNLDGGGSGGLVRAYALLAANVFALSAAFGILSRGAQVDTLISSMEQLEITSGKSIKSVARDLQEASGFGMDFAASLRSTSLALSAGFENKQIFELGEVARNAAVSLGRNVPDALDRIFRGVIKVEPELLDEIGLFVRVNEAASKYASQLGIAVGDLTEFQRRQAFANEAISQGQEKFAAFADVEIDPFAKLATTFSDITQAALTMVNKVIGPLVSLVAENKVIFGQIFLIIAMQLTKMVIPAIGQFTLGIAANAEAAREAAQEQISANQIKIKQLQQEAIEVKKVALENTKAEAKRKRFTDKPQQLKVRGREGSKRIELALQKQELEGAGRLNVVQTRIDDILTERGKKQRMNNEATRRELELLQQEKRVLEEIARLEKEIKGGAPEVGLKKGSFADLTERKAQKNLIKSEALAFTTATTEMQGTMAGFGALSKSIEDAEIKAKQAGVGFNTLDKGMIRLKGTSAILGVGLQKLMMIMGPYITAFMILLPIVTGLAKAVGFFSKEQEALSTANKEAAESFEILNKKLEHAKEQFDKFESDGNLKGMTDSTLAMKEAILSSASALQKQIDAYEEYQKETNIFVKRVNAFFSDLFGDTAQQKITKNAKELVKEIRKSEGGISDELVKLEKNLKAKNLTRTLLGFTGFGEEISTFFFGDAEGKILERAKEEAEAFKNVKSAIDGARDSAREFSDSLIIKTQVDKPLSTFKQITASLQTDLLTEKEKKLLLEETIQDNAVLALLTEDQRNSLHAMTELQIVNGKEVRKITSSNEDILGALEQIELSYARQQELLIRQKSELAQIKSFQSQINNLTKFSGVAIEMSYNLTNQLKDIEMEQLKNDFNRKVTATGLTEERVRQLALMPSLVGKEQELGLTSEQISQVQAAISSMKQVQTREAEEQMRLATEDLRIQNDKVKAALQFMNLEKEVNTMLSSRLMVQAKLANFAKVGSLQLRADQEIKVLSEQEKLRNENLEARIQAEVEVAQFQFKLADVELEVIKQRQEATKEEAKQLNRAASIQLAKTKDDKERAKILKVLQETGQQYIAADNVISTIETTQKGLSTAADNVATTIIGTYAAETEKFGASVAGIIAKTFKNADIGEGFDNLFGLFGADAGIQELLKLKDEKGNKLFTEEMLQMKLFESQILKFAETLKSTFGEAGVLPAVLGESAAAMLAISTQLGEALEFVNLELEDNKATKYSEQTAGAIAAVATAISASLGQLSSVFSAYMQGNIKEIDNLIEAEKKRDGKSKDSLNKLAALEKKKEAMKRKEFETNKKIMLANAVMSTAAGVAGALAHSATLTPVGAMILAGIIAAMGAAQVALISKMQYTGGQPDVQKPNTSLEIGKRSSAVDTAQAATGGELNYLRGGRTTGENLGGAGASLPGAAMGRKGYSMGGEGVVVGERGPEVITPSVPVDITPNFALGGQPANVNFTINAVDAAGVEDVLMNQRGNLIRMIREAANENGERFLETVDTQSYGGSK